MSKRPPPRCWVGRAGRSSSSSAACSSSGFGLYELYRRVLNADFLERLDLASLDAAAQEGVEVAGRVGYAAKGLTTAIAGAFLIVAGVQHDPDEAKGLSGVLKELADAQWGVVLLWAIAAGLILFALFSLVEAKLRRAT